MDTAINKNNPVTASVTGHGCIRRITLPIDCSTNSIHQEETSEQPEDDTTVYYTWLIHI